MAMRPDTNAGGGAASEQPGVPTTGGTSPGRGTPGGSDPARSTATSSPGGDAGSGLGGDEVYDNAGPTAEDPMQGIATRAAQEQTREGEPDDPSGFAGGPDKPTTPGYAP